MTRCGFWLAVGGMAVHMVSVGGWCFGFIPGHLFILILTLVVSDMLVATALVCKGQKLKLWQ